MIWPPRGTARRRCTLWLRSPCRTWGALEVPVARRGSFVKKAMRRPRFEVSPQAPEPSAFTGRGAECTHKDEECPSAPRRCRRAKMTAEVDESPPEQRLYHHTASREHTPRQRRRGQESSARSRRSSCRPGRLGGLPGPRRDQGERCGAPWGEAVSSAIGGGEDTCHPRRAPGRRHVPGGRLRPDQGAGRTSNRPPERGWLGGSSWEARATNLANARVAC